MLDYRIRQRGSVQQKRLHTEHSTLTAPQGHRSGLIRWRAWWQRQWGHL